MSFNSFDISASGMHAQKIKMDTIASNMANVNTTRKPDGSPGVYVRKDVTFKAIYNDKLGDTTPVFPSGNHEAYWSQNQGTIALRGGITYDEKEISQGVQVTEITNSKNPYKTVYDPSNPEADEDGFVTLPNISIVEEMVNMISSSRAYEANSAAAETIKNMIAAALKI